MPEGLTHAKYHRPRATVRDLSLDPARSTSHRDKYDAIADRSTAVADKEERKAGGMSKLDQFTVCALRGFGCRKVELRTGNCGSEFESDLRRAGRTDRDHLWRRKLKIPITNRIARAAPTGIFGNIVGDGTDEASVALSDCFALDMAKYKAFKWDGEQVESDNKEPHTMARFATSAKHEIFLYRLLFGWEHGKERKPALGRLVGFHEKKPELFTIVFLVGCWNRLWFEFTEAVREGVRILMRLLPDGASREALVALALSPRKSTSKRLWRWPTGFSFSPRPGLWKGRILPELEEQLESARIAGSSYLRAHNATVETPMWEIRGRERKRRRNIARLPAEYQKGGKPGNQTNGAKQQDKNNPPAGETTYPLGKRLRYAEFEASKAHAPKDGVTGKPLCWNFNPNCGCGYRGKECERGVHKLTKKGGLHWAAQAQMARRGGVKGSKLLSVNEFDGSILPLREANAKRQAEKTDATHTWVMALKTSNAN